MVETTHLFSITAALCFCDGGSGSDKAAVGLRRPMFPVIFLEGCSSASEAQWLDGI